jgi:hypothetical protein
MDPSLVPLCNLLVSALIAPVVLLYTNRSLQRLLNLHQQTQNAFAEESNRRRQATDEALRDLWHASVDAMEFYTSPTRDDPAIQAATDRFDAAIIRAEPFVPAFVINLFVRMADALGEPNSEAVNNTLLETRKCLVDYLRNHFGLEKDNTHAF